MVTDSEPFAQENVSPQEPTVPEIEMDETVAPRPEEAIADAARAEPDVEDHSRDA